MTMSPVTCSRRTQCSTPRLLPVTPPVFPPASITPAQGKLLELLASVRGARSILELGTLGGYNTIWLARALPHDGRLVTLKLDPRNAEVASANITNAGLAERVQIRVGPAGETLPELHAEGAGPFDVIFIDADKQNKPLYLQWSLKLSRPGTLIIADNVVRGGAILDPHADDQRLQPGCRRSTLLLSHEGAAWITQRGAGHVTRRISRRPRRPMRRNRSR